jgi:hypothetical protein
MRKPVKVGDDKIEFEVLMAEMLAMLQTGGLDRAGLAGGPPEVVKHRRELGAQLRKVMRHMLKMQYQPEKRTPSWRETVSGGRSRIKTILAESPELAGEVESERRFAYRRAFADVVAETFADGEAEFDSKKLPQALPFTVGQVLGDEPFAPEEYE